MPDQIFVRRKGFRDSTGVHVGAITWVIEGRNDLTDAEPIVNRQLRNVHEEDRALDGFQAIVTSDPRNVHDHRRTISGNAASS